MDRLSSCYFCGASLDASLSEYPVVPKALGTSERTVVLCPTCRGKLAIIVESVVDAAGEGTGDGSSPEAATLPSAAEDDDLSGLVDESGTEPGPDPMEVGDANETADGWEFPEDDEPQASESSPEQRTNGERTETASEQDAEEADDDQDDIEEAGDDDGDDTDASLTRLEYNKVMRLLQNRELPVERDQIRTVAINAYEIEPGEFDTIVDAAIDRGLIAEREGQLVAPE